MQEPTSSLVLNDKTHTLTLATPSTEPALRLVLRGKAHTLTLSTPVAMGSIVRDYNPLINKPAINHVTLQGDLTWTDLGLPAYEEISGVPTEPLTKEDLDIILV